MWLSREGQSRQSCSKCKGPEAEVWLAMLENPEEPSMLGAELSKEEAVKEENTWEEGSLLNTLVSSSPTQTN